MITLRSKINRKVLALLFNEPKRSFYVNELAREIDEDPSNVYKKLKELAKEGILLDSFQGKERYFSLNPNFKLLKEYESIILEKTSLTGALKDFAARLKAENKITSAFVLGDYLKNKLKIELLIKGEIKERELMRLISNLKTRLKRDIEYILLSTRSFNLRKQKRDPLLENILKKSWFEL